MDGSRLPVRLQPPKLGEHSRELLAGAGYSDAEITQLRASGIVS
jgi:crotonobetainyl-CoA:carnitine CoA-transferase CaiB-like acyl-CoA transferase